MYGESYLYHFKSDLSFLYTSLLPFSVQLSSTNQVTPRIRHKSCLLTMNQSLQRDPITVKLVS